MAPPVTGPTVPDYIEYGTGLALTSTHLSTGTFVELRREPPGSTWYVGVEKCAFGTHWPLVLNAFNDLHEADAYLYTQSEDPQQALDRMDYIAHQALLQGWIVQ